MRQEKKVLIVEDDPCGARSITGILESAGYAVRTCVATGDEAVRQAEAARPDLVLIKMSLAGSVSGIEAAAIISDQLSIPVVFIVATSDQAAIERAKPIRPVGYLHNPFNQSEVELTVETALHNWKMGRDLQLALGRAEEEKAKTLAVFSAIGVAVAIVDSEYRVLYQNRHHKRLLGETTFGEYCFNAYGSDGQPCPGCPIVSTLTEGKVATFERKLRDGDTDVFLEITTSPLRNQAREIIAGIELVKDITQRKAIDEELADSEEKYRKVTELSPDAIIIHREDGVITFANSGCRRLFQLPDDEDIAERNILSFFANDSINAFLNATLEAMASGAPVPLQEAGIITCSGADVEVEFTSVPFIHRGTRVIQTILRDISDRKKAEHIIRRMAYYDSLTGLPNRRLFDDRLSQVLAHSRRHNRSFAILFIDVDHFKKINDTQGHVFGDNMLKAVAARLTECCRRQGDTVARFGGDEFTVILTDIRDREDVELIISNILQSFRQGFAVNGLLVNTNLSVGVSIYPEDGEDAHSLLMHADMALYEAKQSGRGTFAFYSEPTDLCHDLQLRNN